MDKDEDLVDVNDMNDDTGFDCGVALDDDEVMNDFISVRCVQIFKIIKRCSN